MSVSLLATERGSVPRLSRSDARWRGLAPAAGLLTVLLAGGLTLAAQRPAPLSLPAPEAPRLAAVVPASGVPKLPSEVVDGVLTLAIPAGAAANQQAGGRGYEMPSVISLRVGDRIVIRNDDDEPHMFLYAFVQPGETHERTFTQPGTEVYSSGCGVHAASILNFTSLFVSAGEEGNVG